MHNHHNIDNHFDFHNVPNDFDYIKHVDFHNVSNDFDHSHDNNKYDDNNACDGHLYSQLRE